MPESEKRTHRDESFYRELLAALPASGLTLKALALSRGIKPSTLYAWSRRLRAEDGPTDPGRDRASEDAVDLPTLRPVRMVTAPVGAGANGSMPIEIIVRGDVEIRVPTDLGVEPLARLVSALRG